MNTREDILDLIRTTVRQQEPTAEIILYGSRARGDARPDSDWDVIVLLDKPKNRLTLKEKSEIDYALWFNGVKAGEEINAFAYTKQQWEQMPASTFKQNVATEGILI